MMKSLVNKSYETTTGNHDLEFQATVHILTGIMSEIYYRFKKISQPLGHGPLNSKNEEDTSSECIQYCKEENVLRGPGHRSRFFG